MTDFLDLTGAQAAEATRSGQLSADELFEFYRARAWVAAQGAGAGMCSIGRGAFPGMRSSRVDLHPPAVAMTAARKPSQAPAWTSIAALGPGWFTIR